MVDHNRERLVLPSVNEPRSLLEVCPPSAYLFNDHDASLSGAQ